MATTKTTSKVFKGAYNTEWATIETAIFDTKYLPEVYHIYGDLVRATNLLGIAGKTMSVPNTTISHFERYSPSYSITLLGAIETGTGDITFQIATSDYDANDNPPLRIYDTIEIPYKYMPTGVNEDRLYQIVSVAGATDDLTWTASPINEDGTYDTATEIDTEVPTGTVLRIGHNFYPPGTGQPDPLTDSWATREHVAAIIKESAHYEGGQMAQAFENAILMDMRNGNKGLLLDPVLEVGRRLDKKIESYVVSGERTDNTGLTQSSEFGGTPAAKSGFGFMRWANMLSQEHYYTAGLSVSDLDRIKLLMQTQGIATKKVFVPSGTQYMTHFENAGLDYTQQYSGGSDLITAAKDLGVEFRSYLKSGVQYFPIELSCFSDPSTFGINVGDSYTYQWPKLGLFVPLVDNNVKMNGKQVSIPNIQLGYVNKNGEDRTRVVGIEAGPNRVFPGNFVANDKDGFKVHLFTEIMVIVVNANQWVLSRESK